MNLVDERFSTLSLRALMALTVVLVMLTATGWTAVRDHRTSEDPHSTDLGAWLHGTMNGRRLPRPDAGAGVVGHFFRSLSGAEHDRLVDTYPSVVGNLNGVPVSLRYRANRRALTLARAVAETRSQDSRLSAPGRLEADRHAHRYASLAEPGRQILAFDPAGRGRAAEVFGDLAVADRVSFVVPGVDTDILRFERSRNPYSAPVGMARSLWDAERAAAPSARTAVIAWADYTAPAGIGLDASTGELAARGAERLLDLVDTLPDRVRVSLFCHSYGSVVCGVAAPALPDGKVTDIAVSGSPGMGVDNAALLRTGARVWAARSENDWIGGIPHLEFAGLGHGADPVSAAFGSRVVTSTGVTGHAGYFVPDTASLDNFAGIALGRYRSVECVPDSDCTAGSGQPPPATGAL